MFSLIDWIASTSLRLIGWLLCRLPPEVALGIGEGLGLLGYLLRPKRARIGVQNLRAAFDGQFTVRQTRQMVRACYRQMGAGVLELLRLPVMDKAYVERYIEIKPWSRFEEAARSERPTMVLTGHFGNWELTAIAGALRGHPIMVLARTQKNFPRLYKLLVSYRESKGCTVVHKGGALRQLIKALEQGKVVGIVGDQASRQGIFVELFGRPALFATGPFSLAYDKEALILPVFIHRRHGPYHRLMVEPPIEFPPRASKTEAVKSGIEQFATLLERHTREDPTQWLWMHRRWKYTPARRVLVLSDGKAGHLKQAVAVTEALSEQSPHVTHTVIEVAFRNRFVRTLALVWSWWMPRRWGAAQCLSWTLTPESAHRLLTRYADVIISCGASLVPINALWASENGAKSVVIMNPAPLPVRQFDLVIAPRHDRLPSHPHLIQTMGAISRTDDQRLLEASVRLQMHPKFRGTLPVRRPGGRAAETGPRNPVVAVFLGGDSVDYELTPGFVEQAIIEILAVCDAMDGCCLVTTSRRTSPAVERLLSARLSKHPRCRLLIIANRDPLEGTMEGMLGAADVHVVTGESISMVSEACGSGRYVVVIEPPLRRGNRTTLTKHQRFLHELVLDGYVRLQLVPGLSHAIQRVLQGTRPPKRLESYGLVRDAVAQFL